MAPAEVCPLSPAFPFPVRRLLFPPPLVTRTSKHKRYGLHSRSGILRGTSMATLAQTPYPLHHLPNSLFCLDRFRARYKSRECDGPHFGSGQSHAVCPGGFVTPFKTQLVSHRAKLTAGRCLDRDGLVDFRTDRYCPLAISYGPQSHRQVHCAAYLVSPCLSLGLKFKSKAFEFLLHRHRLMYAESPSKLNCSHVSCKCPPAMLATPSRHIPSALPVTTADHPAQSRFS